MWGFMWGLYVRGLYVCGRLHVLCMFEVCMLTAQTADPNSATQAGPGWPTLSPCYVHVRIKETPLHALFQAARAAGAAVRALSSASRSVGGGGGADLLAAPCGCGL